jgi:hypothetical protein
LEDRTLLSAPPVQPVVPAVTPSLTVSSGYNVKVFATNPAGTSQPDSIVVDGSKIYVGYSNGVAKDGTDGKSSTIVEYDSTGTVVKTFQVLGHNDGLKVDPETNLLWSLQNEDGNPNLVVINPTTGSEKSYTLTSVNGGGGFDDISFLHDKVFFSASSPANNPNTDPAVVEAHLSGATVTLTPVLYGNATATKAVTHKQVTLNLQDPDSMTSDRAGDLVLTSQSDDELVIIKHPGTDDQSVTLLPLTDAKSNSVSVDDTLFHHGGEGEVFLTDLTAGTIYSITGPALRSDLPLSAAQDIGQLGTVNFHTGVFTPVITGLGSPRGLAFLSLDDNGNQDHEHSDQGGGDQVDAGVAPRDLTGLANTSARDVVIGNLLAGSNSDNVLLGQMLATNAQRDALVNVSGAPVDAGIIEALTSHHRANDGSDL